MDPTNVEAAGLQPSRAVRSKRAPQPKRPSRDGMEARPTVKRRVFDNRSPPLDGEEEPF
jgi:hypothetical protein